VAWAAFEREMVKVMFEALEKRIASTLSDESVTSQTLGDLIPELEAAVAVADRAAEDARARALDLVDSPDAEKAEDAMKTAEFRRDRLRTALPRLKERHAAVAAAEYAACWNSDCDSVEAQRNAVAREFVEVYRNVAAQLIDLFERMEAVDKEVSRVNRSAPDGEHRRLLEAELTARGLERFTVMENPSIPQKVQLPDPEESAKMAWPRPTVPFGVLVASSVVLPQIGFRHGKHGGI
jgi:hypothetical protein